MKNKIILILIFLANSFFCFSQKKIENIGSEVVNVVKSYSPSVSDAFKVKETPSIDDEETSKIEVVKYNIFSFPVASTFVPIKGKATNTEKTKTEKLFNNYASIAIGNFGTLNAEVFVTTEITKTAFFGVSAQHLSSQGGIKNVKLSDKFYTTSIDLTFGENLKKYSYSINTNFQNQIYNYYGLPADFGKYLSETNKEIKLNSIDSKQNYSNFFISGNVLVNENIFKGMNINYDRFSDAFSSVENHFYVKPIVEFKLFNTKIKTNIIADYLTGSFDKNYYNINITPIQYRFLNIGINPNVSISKDNWLINIGANIFYVSSSIDKSSKVFIYPQILTTLKIIDNVLVFYAGAEGGIIQNTYRDFTNSNPFLSPTFEIRPTEKQYDIFAGFKGKLNTVVSYNIRGSLTNEKYKPLFQSNDYFLFNSNQNGYANGNSMQIIYDNVKTIAFFAELKSNFSQSLSFVINATLNSFVMDKEEKPWNLPNLKLNANLDYDITQKWFVGTTIFYIGERIDRQIDTNSMLYKTVLPNIYDKILTSYFDLKAHLGYKHSEKITAFLKLNNLINQEYQKWLNYPVQGLQMLLGVSYKF